MYSERWLTGVAPLHFRLKEIYHPSDSKPIGMLLQMLGAMNISQPWKGYAADNGRFASSMFCTAIT
jgi:hypothetical protein